MPLFGRILARPLILLAAVLLGGEFLRLKMWLTGVGIAEMNLAGFGRIRQGLTIAGGLVGPAVAAAIWACSSR